MGYKVLVIDDEPWSRSLVISQVQWKQLDLELVGEAEDTYEGLDKINQIHPHIIITDMKMPGLNPVDFLKKVHEASPRSQLLVLSGYDEFGYLRQALRSGAVDYLLKPVDPELLNKNLTECIRRLKEDLAGGFPDARAYQEYVWFRKKLLQELSELDGHSITRTFAQLSNLLKEKIFLPRDLWMLEGIKMEILDQLGEFLREFTLEKKQDQKIRSPDQHPIAGDLATDSETLCNNLLASYLEGIRWVQNYQNSRKFLDPVEVSRYIDQHYLQNINLDSLAKLFLVTKEHLCRTYRQKYGLTILDSITKNRMDRAQKLLMDQNTCIKELPVLCGYADLPYFYRVFKQYFGVTPAQMRKSRDESSI